jgi:hypothetical protein
MKGRTKQQGQAIADLSGENALKGAAPEPKTNSTDGIPSAAGEGEAEELRYDEWATPFYLR